MRNPQRIILFFSILIIELFNLVNSKYILFARDWLVNPEGLAGWSNTTTEMCKGQIMDANKLVFMLDKDSQKVHKTFENLPNHWSVGIRIDFIIVDNWKGASMTISFDEQVLGKYVSTGKGKKLLICGYEKEEDKYERGYYNITHQTDKFILNIEHTITNYAKLALLDLQVYLELCDNSCSKCKGPTNSDCTECPFGLDLVDGQCICNNGYMHQGTCVQDCPELYKKDENNKVCQHDPCQANCLQCNESNHKCVLCKEGFNLLYGDCIDLCPSYTQLQNGVCIDEMHNYWNGTYLVKAFFGNDFSYPEISGYKFKSNFFDDEEIIPKENWAQFSDCNNLRLYGGFGLYGRRTQISNEWVIPWYHSSVRIRFFYAQIENYEKDPETGEDEKLSIYLNGVEKWFMTKGQDNKNACGRLDQGEHFGWLEANMTNLKRGDKLTFEVKNNFYDPAWFEGFGLREFTVIVDRCTSNCIECKDDLGCVKCEDNYFMHKSYCLDQCPPGYYGDIMTMTCKECHLDCLECNQKENYNCTKCRSSRFLHQGMCITKCPPEFYNNYQDNTCGDCIQGCISCTDPTKNTCQGCKSEFVELDKVCSSYCPEGYFKDQSNKCIQCHSLCQKCSGPSESECESCKQNSQTYLYKNQCLYECPQGFYSDDDLGKCLNCLKTCQSCQNSITCINCKESLFLFNDQCETECPENYYKDYSSKSCKQCFDGCKTCKDSQEDQCFSCVNNFYFFEGRCLESCPTSYFEKPDENPICEKCDESCLKCFGKQKNQCKQCSKGNFLHENYCTKQCPQGYIENQKANKCQQCTNNCQICTSIDENSCIECQQGSFLYEGLCLLICPQQMFGDLILKKCMNCPNGCSICKPDQCIKCSGKNRLGPIDNCICQQGYTDIIGRQNKQLSNCIKEKPNPTPKIIIDELSTQSKLISKKTYKITGILQFDMDVRLKDHHLWNIYIPKTDSKVYRIQYTPIQKKKMYSEIEESELESEQVVTLEIFIIDSSQIMSDQIRIEFNDIYTVQNTNENPLQVSFIESKLPIFKEEQQIFEKFEQSQFNLGMNYFMIFLAMIIVFILPLYQTINLFDILQIINHLNLLNVKYPTYLSYFFKIFDVYNLHVLPSFSNIDSKAPIKFRQNNIDTFFFSNISQSAILWILFYGIFLISKLHNNEKLQNKFRSLLKRYHNSFKYKIVFTLFYVTYCNMLLFTFLQLVDNSFESVTSSFGYLFCLVFLGYFVIIHYYTYQSTQCSINQIMTIPEKVSLYNLFYNGIYKSQGKSIFYSLILIRKTLLTYILVFSCEDRIKQTLLWCLIIGLETLSFALIQPFKQKSENQILLLSRLLIICSLICIVSLGIDNESEGFSDQGRMLITGIVIVFNSIAFFSLLFNYVYSSCKAKIISIVRTSLKKEIKV